MHEALKLGGIMISQKLAVVQVLMSILEERGVSYELGGETILNDVLNDEDKKTAREHLCAGFHAGKISMSAEAQGKYVGNEVEMKKYVSGLLNNWIRKEPTFNNNFKNAGGKYQAKNPGSRTGQTDETVKNLRLLLKTQTDPRVISEIEQAIADRIAEIKPETVVIVNVEAIPEHLRKFIK